MSAPGGWSKGPWKATRSDPAEGVDVWWITACPAPNMETEIATVQGGHPHDKREATARLIAAAPALYEVLRKIAAPMDCGCVPCRGQCRSAEALQIEIDAIKDAAEAALLTATQPGDVA